MRRWCCFSGRFSARWSVLEQAAGHSWGSGCRIDGPSDAYYGIFCVVIGIFMLAWRYFRLEWRRPGVATSPTIRGVDLLLATVAAGIVARMATGPSVLQAGRYESRSTRSTVQRSPQWSSARFACGCDGVRRFASQALRAKFGRGSSQAQWRSVRVSSCCRRS